MVDVKELQKALKQVIDELNNSIHVNTLDGTLGINSLELRLHKDKLNNFERLFSAFQELSLSAQSKEPSLRKLLEDPALLEKLADLEHEQWSQCVLWMQKSGHAFGTKAQRWVLWRAWDILAHTNYSDLTEKQKESDRKIARKVLEVFDETFTRKVSGVEEK